MLSIQPVNMLSFCSVSATHKDILRGTHSLYDQLGFYSPLSVKGKILLQDLNREKVPLEQKLSDQQLDRWRMIAADISSAVDQRIMSVSRPFFPFHLDRCELTYLVTLVGVRMELWPIWCKITKLCSSWRSLKSTRRKKIV